MKKSKLCIAVPASVVSDTPHLREKTSKIGLIGRAAAIFTVDEIIIYPDNPHANQKAESDLIALLLTYMETPQYLRKRLFKLEPELQYAGILPPLRTPHHPLNARLKGLSVGKYREGVVLSRTGDGALVDIGIENPAFLRNNRAVERTRITARIVRVAERAEIELATREEVPSYWGYSVFVEKHSLGSILGKRSFGLVIATSKYGSPLYEIAEKIAAKWEKAGSILVAFGAPTQGLTEIAQHEGIHLDDIADFVVNTVPNQGTETVRTEEAILASLATLKVVAELKG